MTNSTIRGAKAAFGSKRTQRARSLNSMREFHYDALLEGHESHIVLNLDLKKSAELRGERKEVAKT